MLKIKLARFGKKNQPHYRVVVNEARDKRDGSYVALIGHYAPVQTPKLLEINVENYQYWISKGAQPTDTVASLVKRFKSGNPFSEKKAKLSKKAKAKLTAKNDQNKEEPAKVKKEKVEVVKAAATPTETKPESAKK